MLQWPPQRPFLLLTHSSENQQLNHHHQQQNLPNATLQLQEQTTLPEAIKLTNKKKLMVMVEVASSDGSRRNSSQNYVER